MVDLDGAWLGVVEKPTRYTGNEWNEVKKDWEQVACTFALAMADVYEVGMSNLGLRILYEALNAEANIAAERVFAPWPDMEKEMRARDLPLFSLETRHEIRTFDLLGFSLQYELLHATMLNMLALARIPIWARERTLADPFLIGGGPCVYNTEPIADFFDLFLLGDGEEAVVEIAQALIAWKRAGKPQGRKGFLLRAAKISGVYVPSFYAPRYDENGRFASITPIEAGIPNIVYRRVVKDMDAVPFLSRPIVPYLKIVHDRLMLELFRGCTRGCRFCQAGMSYRPVRERKPAHLKEIAKQMLEATGYGEMSLTSLSSADYSCLEPLVENLLQDYGNQRVSFSLPSLRIDSFSVELAHKMQTVRKSGLTFAPEAGTQRLRDVINKGVTEEDLMRSVKAAFANGWKSVKLYFMMGLPTERDEDILGIAALAKKVVDAYQEVKGRRGVKVTVSVSCFVPKPFTPFQWFGQIAREEFERRQQLLKHAIKDHAITFNYHDARASVLEGVLSRGDRKLSAVIYRAWQKGAKFDGWTEAYQDDVWQQAFIETGIDPQTYAARDRDMDEPLPWEHTSPGVTRAFLQREWQKAQQAALTEDCRRGKCSACGVCPQLGVQVIDWQTERAKKGAVHG